MKVSTEIDNNFGHEKITQLVDNIPLKEVVLIYWSFIALFGIACREYPVLPVSQDSPLLTARSIFSNVYIVLLSLISINILTLPLIIDISI
jgi:hypothetical protein